MDYSPAGQNFLTVADVARTLDRSTEQVRRYLREGQLVGNRMGGQWFITSDALDAFLANQHREDRFLRTLRAATRVKPLDDVIGIGSGPGSDIVQGISSYRGASLQRNQGR